MRSLVLSLVVAGTLAAVACSSSDSDSDESGGGDDGTDGGSLRDGGADANADDRDASAGQRDATVDGPALDGGDEDDAGGKGDAGDSGQPGAFTLSSTAFAEGAAIPTAHACNANASPPLAWANPPAGTLSFAVVMRDLSLVNQPNYHWVIYDIPAVNTSLPQGISAVANPPVPAGAKQTYWSFGASYSYLGPCPPSGEHTYQFTVLAFATATLPVPSGTTDPAAVDAVIQANKTASASLTGKYAKP